MTTPSVAHLPCPPDADAPALVQQIDRLWRAGAGRVVLDGPDVLGRSELRPVLRHVRRRGLELGLVIVADPRLHDPHVVERAVDALNLRWARLDVVDRAAVGPLLDAGVTVEIAWRGEASLAEAASALAATPGSAAWGVPRCHLPDGTSAAPDGDAAAGRVKPPACAGCAEHPTCPGVPVGWFRTHGDGELRPVAERASRDIGRLFGVPIRGGAPDRRPAESARLDVAPRYPDTALVTLMVPGCDLACVFCDVPQADPTAIAFSTRATVRASLEALAGRASGVFFTGGEPTGLPWLLDALRDARELGYERGQLQTHAGRAADPAFADALIAAGLTGVDVPLYGATAEVHEAITHTPGSFERTLAGLAALRERGARAVVHTTLFASNLPHLAALLAHVDALAPDALYVQLAGALGPGGPEVPTPAVAGAAVAAALDARPMQTPVWLSDLAPCHVPGHADRVSRWRGPEERASGAVVLPYGEWLMTFTAGAARRQASACRGCSWRSRCDGVPLEVLDRLGDAAVTPIGP